MGSSKINAQGHSQGHVTSASMCVFLKGHSTQTNFFLLSRYDLQFISRYVYL